MTIFASSLDHYTRRDLRLDRGTRREEQYFDGVRFVLLKTLGYRRNDWRRFVNMTSYAVNAFQAGIHLLEKPDVIVGSSPHPLAALAALALARLKRCRYFFELRDLWPEFFLETAVLSKRHPIVPLFRWIVSLCLRHAERVMTVWPDMDTYLEERGVQRDKAIWIPIGLEFPALDQETPEGPSTRNGQFVAMYRGGFGQSNDVKTIVDAARELQARGQNRIRIVLAGDGVAKPILQEYVRALALKNVGFESFVPKNQMGRALTGADVLLCCLPGLPHFQKYGQIASKLLDYLASGRPTIIATNIRDNLVSNANAGIVVPPEQPRALAEAIMHMATLAPAELARMGRNGRNYVRQHHDITALADRVECALIAKSQQRTPVGHGAEEVGR